ncbi:AraC family transcriptional regulator [uncultured Roseobacter sp.]|uniref:AraC family transcriptional regulator n=1 Tax=uncultured Roseobacter sp. TaxID=114847 RepID=UPI002628F23A|nr:AraC family transcriptional regulator [uncultured Roseobacter sp.]
MFETPGVAISLENTDFLTRSPAALLVAPGIAHGFRFPENTEGDVLTFTMAALDADTQSRIMALSGSGAVLTEQTGAPGFADIRTTAAQLRRTFAGVSVNRDAMLCTLARLMVLCFRSGEKKQNSGSRPLESPETTLHEKQAQAFCDAVEAHFGDALSVSDYARLTGVSPAHLTRVCKRLLGITPNELVRQRRMVEARRLLEFTRHSVAEIAARSGFQDPAFFSRTFRQQNGQSPGSFRAEKDSD